MITLYESIGDSTVGKRMVQPRPALVDYFRRIDAFTSADRV
jgi:hypothetical protein